MCRSFSNGTRSVPATEDAHAEREKNPIEKICMTRHPVGQHHAVVGTTRRGTAWVA